MSEREDKLLAESMDKLGRQNEEVEGDEDTEEEEDTGMGDIDLESNSSAITDWKKEEKEKAFEQVHWYVKYYIFILFRSIRSRSGEKNIPAFFGVWLIIKVLQDFQEKVA